MVTGTVDALRRITHEPSTSGTYSDSDMANYLSWAGDDLYGAGYMIWAEKVAALEGNYDYSADGESYRLSQKIESAERMMAICANHRSGTTSQWIKDPPETDDESELQE